MRKSKFRCERGMAFVTAMITGAVLITITAASLIYSRSDVMVSDNAKYGSRALWIAQLGAERAKNFLRTDGTWKTVTSTATVAAAGTTYAGLPGATYSTTVAPYGGTPGRFLIQAGGTAPDASTAQIEEIVAFVDDSLGFDAINVQGIGTHTALDENNIHIPKYFIDARDHDRNGRPCLTGSPSCTNFTAAAIAGTATTINNDVKQELFRLREHMVGDGNACNASGSNCDGDFEAGLYWIKKQVPAYSTASCNEGDPAPCYKALPLNVPHLHANDHASNVAPVYTSGGGDTPWSEMFVGPIHGTPETRVLSNADDVILQQRIQRLLEFALNTDVSRRRAISADLTTNQTYGSWDDPKVVIICDTNSNNAKMARLSTEPPCNGNNAPNVTYVRNDAVVTGTGLLIVPRELQFNDARFNWRGIVLLLEQGRFTIKNGGNPNVAGMVLGTVVAQDATGSDPKIKLIGVTTSTTATNPFYGEPATSPAPPSFVQTIHGFGVKFSRESINNALGAGMTTLAWREVYAGEQ